MKTISVIGLGYIGLPTAAVIASKGVDVIGVDINKAAVDLINQGKIHIIEPDLDELVHEVVSKGLLKAVTKPKPADAFLIAVPTPFTEGHQPNLDYVRAAIISISSVLKAGDLVILESTSPVGTTEKISEWLAELRADLTFPHDYGQDSSIRIAYCPERVLPGHTLSELIKNDRVIGGVTEKCSMAAAKLYKIFVAGESLFTNARTAEMCKLTENSFRDVNIAFANELSIISAKLNINVWELIRLANRHPRVSILDPGPGVGGHCIAVDPWFIVSSAMAESRIIRTAREVNDFKPNWVAEKITSSVHDYLRENPSLKKNDIKIGFFGLSFKPNIDDLRESPALKIAEMFVDLDVGALVAVEPHISQIPDSLSKSFSLMDHESAIRECNIIVYLVKHANFYQLIKQIPSAKIIIDVCGILS